ncbi:hypothetical protein HDU96_004899, partial [Phlyctochytrium bullatum]
IEQLNQSLQQQARALSSVVTKSGKIYNKCRSLSEELERSETEKKRLQEIINIQIAIIEHKECVISRQAASKRKAKGRGKTSATAAAAAAAATKKKNMNDTSSQMELLHKLVTTIDMATQAGNLQADSVANVYVQTAVISDEQISTDATTQTAGEPQIAQVPAAQIPTAVYENIVDSVNIDGLEQASQSSLSSILDNAPLSEAADASTLPSTIESSEPKSQTPGLASTEPEIEPETELRALQELLGVKDGRIQELEKDLAVSDERAE